jgi:hypothetical protein
VSDDRALAFLAPYGPNSWVPVGWLDELPEFSELREWARVDWPGPVPLPGMEITVGGVDPALLDLYYGNTKEDIDIVAEFETKDSGKRAEFVNGGVRDSQDGKPRFDLTQPETVPYADQMLTRFAALMGRGAEKYEDRNWELFSDREALSRAHSSAFRHFMQWLNGEVDEDHAAAVWFNIMAAEYIKGVLDGRWSARRDLTTQPGWSVEVDETGLAKLISKKEAV